MTVIVDMHVKKQYIDFVKNELCKLISPTLNELGCINYMFYQDINEKTFFHSYENWNNYEVIQKHLNSYHIKNFLRITQGCFEQF